uniref:Peptidase A1 domain-containing protein n=1 Tax=Parastrongyloides trichosuri TaxID=131310 RepID=A0A0N4ZMB1_PARTI
MFFDCIIIMTFFYLCIDGQLRNRPRGLGLIKLPTGATDERSGLFMPNLRVSGNQNDGKPQTVRGVSLTGQKADFEPKASFDPFTNTVGVGYNEDISDSWGFGYAISGINNYLLKVRENFDEFADLPSIKQDPQMQPFVNSFEIGGEFDLKKISEVAVFSDIPIAGVNEFFDINLNAFQKSRGLAMIKEEIDFPLILSEPSERFIQNYNTINFYADRHLQYGHKMPSINMFGIPKEKIISRLVNNRANPMFIG